MTDPFADAPFDDEIQEDAAPQESPWEDNTDKKEKALVIQSEGKVVLTFKGGRDFDAPWVVVHAEDVDDAMSQISGDNAAKFKELVDATAKVGKYFAGTGNSGGGGAKSGGGQQSQQRGKPAGATEAPNGETQTCKCGDEMKFVSGFSQKTNKNYAFFACPKPQNSQCEGNNGRSYTVNYKG